MRSTLALVALSFVIGAGCQSQPEGNGPGPDTARTGGKSGTPTRTGGSSGSTGGSSGGAGAGTGGATVPGSGGAAGASAAGGAGGASSGSGGSGAGGSTATDASGAGGSSGGDAPPAGEARPVKPSAGCGKANPATGMRTIMTGGRTANYVVNLPATYDPMKPLPLGFAFHGYGNGLCTGECAGFRNLNAITIFPKALSAGWEDGANLAPNIKLFEDLLALAKTEYCVDENRIIVAGTSSGGQFTEHLVCRYGDQLWAGAPVAAYVDRGVDMNCKGTPGIIVIHGVTDRAGNFGQSVAELYAKRNGCAATPPAGLAMARMEMMAAFSARRAEYKCLDWAGCTANPVRYCISSQITYSGLTHGWPRVGGMLISEFLGTLK